MTFLLNLTNHSIYKIPKIKSAKFNVSTSDYIKLPNITFKIPNANPCSLINFSTISKLHFQIKTIKHQFFNLIL